MAALSACAPRARVGCVAQEAPDGEESLIDCVLAHDRERDQPCWRRPKRQADGHRLAEIHERMAAIDAHSAPARAAAILAGLGFDAEAQARPCRRLFGRLADARRSGRRLVRPPRSAVAGRTDQPSGSRSDTCGWKTIWPAIPAR